jgi:hypothetical protein
VEFFHKNEYVRSYSIYKHDTTLKMTLGANFFLDDFNSGPPTYTITVIINNLLTMPGSNRVRPAANDLLSVA